MEEWAENYNPSHRLDSMEEEIVTALHHAANTVMPTISSSISPQKKMWYYNDKNWSAPALTRQSQEKKN